MTKSREKLINKAKKYNISENKINYLSNETKGYHEYFFESIFYFIRTHTDEELNNDGYRFLEELYLYIDNKRTFTNIIDNVARFDCNCRKILDYFYLIKDYRLGILNDPNKNDLSVFQYFIIFEAANYNIADALQIIQIVSIDKHPEEYLRLLSCSNFGKKPIQLSIEDRNNYIQYYIQVYLENTKGLIDYEKYFYLRDLSKNLYKFFKLHIPYDIAKQNDFNIANIFKHNFSLFFPNTNSYLNNLEVKKYHFTSDRYEWEYIYDPNNGIKEAKKILRNGTIDYKAYLDVPITKINITKNENCLNININRYKNIYFAKYIRKNKKETVITPNYQSLTNTRSIFIFYDNQPTFYEKRYGKFIPLSLKVLFELKEICPIGELLMKDMAENGSKIFLDFLRYPMKSDYYKTPVIINDLIGKQNLNHYFLKYKNGHYFNWNKGNYQQYYIIMKSLSYIKKEDWTKIIACKDHLSLYNFSSVDLFLISYLEQHLNKSNKLNDHEQHIISDYIEMCKINKNKIDINLRSFQKLKRAHDLEISQINISGNTLKIPKNSVYKKLRKFLPIEFEWIKNKNRLIQEGKIQGHCVASYADKITRDKCAIYSVVYKDIRYTIEFLYKPENDTYRINQCQSKFNHMHSNNFDYSIIDYIKTFSNKIV